MALETGDYVDDLDQANPLNTDSRSQGAAHLRLIKKVILQTFPNITGAMTVSHTDLNWLGESGHRVLFQQSTPPTGWTKVTAGVDNRALRLVSGAVGSGGSTAFTSAFNSSRSVSNTGLSTNNAGSHNHGGTNNTTISTSQMPSHGHDVWGYGGSGTETDGFQRGGGTPQLLGVQSTGSSNSHSHGISNDGDHSHSIDSHNHSFNLNVQYLDFIVAEKD